LEATLRLWLFLAMRHTSSLHASECYEGIVSDDGRLVSVYKGEGHKVDELDQRGQERAVLDEHLRVALVLALDNLFALTRC